jgi:hypothetical protein
MPVRAAFTLLLLLVLAAPAGAAETAYLYDASGPSLRIVALDGTGRALTDPLPISGLGGGDAITGLDVRTSDGKLYALTVNTGPNPDQAELYRLDVAEAAVTAVSVGSPAFVPSGSFGIDFNPETDLLRAVSTSGQNLRIDPDDGSLVETDTALAYVAGDANDGDAPSIAAIGYSPFGNLFAIAGAGEKNLARIGGAGGEAPSPNGGLVTTIGETHIAPGFGTGDALDVSSATGEIYWLRPGFFRADVYRLDGNLGAAQDAIPFDVFATSFALLPASKISLGSLVSSFSEGAGTATLLVNRTAPTTGPASVGWVVERGSSDVTPTGGFISFDEGETQKEISVPIPQDTAVEGRESFMVRISGPNGNRFAGAVLGNPLTTVSVEDDDVAPVATATPTPTPTGTTGTGTADTVKPTLRITGVPRRALTRAKLLKGFTARVLPSEAATLDVALRGTPRRGAFSSSFELSLFTKRYARSAFTRSVKVRPSKRLVGRIRRAAKLRLGFDAVDAAGNRTTVTRTISVKR